MRSRLILIVLLAAAVAAEAAAVRGVTRVLLRTPTASKAALAVPQPTVKVTSVAPVVSTVKSGTFTVQFTELGTHATRAKVMERLFSSGSVARFVGAVPSETTAEQLVEQADALMLSYVPAKEQFQVIIPASFNTNNASEWGLFVWCSPGGKPELPSGWLAALERHKLLFVSPLNNGNARNTQAQSKGSAFPFCNYEPFAGALVARHNMVQRYGLDEKRVFVSGHSGGANTASELGVCFPDQFAGAIPFMSCKGYAALPGSATAGGAKWEKYLDPLYDQPSESILNRARQESRFVLVAGKSDTVPFGGSWKGANRQQAELLFTHQFQKDDFKQARFILAPTGHGLPSAAVLDEALRFVDGPR